MWQWTERDDEKWGVTMEKYFLIQTGSKTRKIFLEKKIFPIYVSFSTDKRKCHKMGCYYGKHFCDTEFHENNNKKNKNT